MRLSLGLLVGSALWGALGAGDASAQSCLEGARALEDGRALVALADTIDTSCPCASAPSRSSYRKCAKQARDQALAAGELRSECKKKATRAYKAATCGTDLVTCGQFKPSSSSEPFRCRVTRPDRCRDKKKVDATACFEETHCSDVVDRTASTCMDPAAAGPHLAASRTVSWTKPSAVDPLVDRQLNTLLYYPAAGGGTPAAVDPTGAPYPVVLFSHGSCGYPSQSNFLNNLLATHGYIVVAPPHPGNTLNEFPNCGTPAAQVDSAVERPRDVIFVLDQILAENDDPGSDFYGMVDPTRIAMSGHSFGGLTTYLVQAMEPRVDVALPFAPAANPSFQLTVPSLTMVGEVDSVVNNASTRVAYEQSVTPKLFVEIENAGHYAFSDLCFPSSDCNPPVTLTQQEAADVVKRWVVPFLEVYLRGDQAYAPLLHPAPRPGVVIDAEP